MDKTFLIEILTPERVFFNGTVQSVSVEAAGGRLTVLAGHAPMVCTLSVGQLLINTGEEQKIAFHSKGYMDVTRDYVVILCQACEWPDEIDEARAREAAERASERLETQVAPDEVGRSKLALLRALSRLRVKDYTGRGQD